MSLSLISLTFGCITHNFWWIKKLEQFLAVLLSCVIQTVVSRIQPSCKNGAILWKKGQGEKSCEMQETAVKKGGGRSGTKNLITKIQVDLCCLTLVIGTKFTRIVIIKFFFHWSTTIAISWLLPPAFHNFFTLAAAASFFYNLAVFE